MRLKNSPLRRLPGKIFFCELEKLALPLRFSFHLQSKFGFETFRAGYCKYFGGGVGRELNKNIYKPIVTDKANGRRVLVQKELR